MLAVVVALAVRWPRMDESVFVDEEHTLRAYMHGQFTEAAEGKPVFEPIPWGFNMWRNTIGNNHFLYSVVSRVSMDIGRWASGATRAAFSETAFRLPSLLAGLGSLVVLGCAAGAAGVSRCRVAGRVADGAAPLACEIFCGGAGLRAYARLPFGSYAMRCACLAGCAMAMVDRLRCPQLPGDVILCWGTQPVPCGRSWGKMAKRPHVSSGLPGAPLHGCQRAHRDTYDPNDGAVDT